MNHLLAILSLLYCFKVIYSMSVLEFFSFTSNCHTLENFIFSSMGLRPLFTVLSSFRNFQVRYCHLLFNYQCSSLSCDSLFRLSHLFCFVNNFFKVFYFLFFKLLSRSQQMLSYHVFFKVSTPFLVFVIN